MNRSLLLVLAGVAALVVLFFVFRGGDSSSTGTTTASTSTAATTTGATTTGATTSTTTTAPTAPQFVPIAITVKNAKPVGGIHRATVRQGEKVHLIVTSDTVDEIHLHGYDLHSEVEHGKAQINFTANIAGRFEAELEDHGVQILDLEVKP
jgi:hypothetical protein